MSDLFKEFCQRRLTAHLLHPLPALTRPGGKRGKEGEGREGEGRKEGRKEGREEGREGSRGEMGVGTEERLGYWDRGQGYLST